MDDLIERVQRDLDDLAPLPAFDDVRRRAAHRARRRRVGAGVLGVAVAVAVIAGAWTLAVREGERPTQSEIPGATASTEQLFLAGDGEAWVVDPARLASRSRNTPYAGREVRGRVRHTFLRGRPTVLDGEATR